MDGSLCPKGLWSRKLLYDSIYVHEQNQLYRRKEHEVFVGITAADVGKPPLITRYESNAGPENGFSETTRLYILGS